MKTRRLIVTIASLVFVFGVVTMVISMGLTRRGHAHTREVAHHWHDGHWHSAAGIANISRYETESTPNTESTTITESKSEKPSNKQEGGKKVVRVAASVLADNEPRVIWLVQGKAETYSLWRRRFEGTSAVLLYHSYDRPCDGCIFQNGTTWITGNNLLVGHAFQQTTSSLKYYVRSDADLQMKCGPSRQLHGPVCWKRFQRALEVANTSSRPMIAPKTWWDGDEKYDTYQTCTDHAIMAISRDFLSLLFPMPTYKQDEAWNYVSHALWELGQHCAPRSMLTLGLFEVENPVHGEYPQRYTDKLVENRTAALLRVEYGAIKSWKVRSYRLTHRCGVRNDTLKSRTSIHYLKKCKRILDRRLESWLEQGAPIGGPNVG